MHRTRRRAGVTSSSADADSDRILFRCTATTTSEAIVAALHAVGARRIVLVTPYIRPVNEREVAFLEHNGFAVLREHGPELPGGRELRRVEPAEWYRTVMAQRDERAEAYFVSCANVRAAEIIETPERDLARPVATSNTAAVWRCLRESGVGDVVSGFGTLLRM